MKIIVLITAIVGGILSCAGAVTSYVATFNNAPAAQITGYVFGGLGVVSIIMAALAHVWDTNSTPPPPPANPPAAH